MPSIDADKNTGGRPCRGIPSNSVSLWHGLPGATPTGLAPLVHIMAQCECVCVSVWVGGVVLVHACTCGCVCICMPSCQQTPYSFFFFALSQTLPAAIGASASKHIEALFDWALSACLRLVRKEIKEISPTEDSNIART